MDEVRGVKGRGYLHNKGTDTFSARVVTPCGRITFEQARRLADIGLSVGGTGPKVRPVVVEKVLIFYRDRGEKGERLFKTLVRLGCGAI